MAAAPARSDLYRPIYTPTTSTSTATTTTTADTGTVSRRPLTTDMPGPPDTRPSARRFGGGVDGIAEYAQWMRAYAGAGEDRPMSGGSVVARAGEEDRRTGWGGAGVNREEGRGKEEGARAVDFSTVS